MSPNHANKAVSPLRLADTRAVLVVARVSSVMAVAALGVLLLTIAVSVVARYVLAAPLLGSNEILQSTLVALVALALLPAVHGEHHIRVDVLDSVIGKYGCYAGDLFARAMGAYVLLTLAYRALQQAREAAEFADATNMLQLPLWPFYGSILVGSLLYAVMLVIQTIDLIRLGVPNDD